MWRLSSYRVCTVASDYIEKHLVNNYFISWQLLLYFVVKKSDLANTWILKLYLWDAKLWEAILILCKGLFCRWLKAATPFYQTSVCVLNQVNFSINGTLCLILSTNQKARYMHLSIEFTAWFMPHVAVNSEQRTFCCHFSE